MLEAVGAGLAAEALRPFMKGFVDQMSIYLQCVPFARLSAGEVHIRVGAERSYVLCELRDRRRPLRVREVSATWDVYMQSSRIDEFVGRTNARRRKFLDTCMHTMLRPLCRGIAVRLDEYFSRRPYARPEFSMARILEDVGNSVFCIDFDERGVPLKTDTYKQRYMVQ